MNMSRPQNTKQTVRALALIGAMGLMASQAALAADAVDMSEQARANGCFSCHSPQEKIVGPAFASVAAKYAGQKDAASDLVMSIQNGSTGKWGRAAMPAHSNMSAAEIRRLAEWVLTIKKQ